MENLTAKLTAIAIKRGLVPNNPVLVTITDGTYVTYVSIAYEEPAEGITPLNVVWLRPTSNDLLRRRSRESSGNFLNTWDPVTEGNLYVEQDWDIPQPQNKLEYEHALLIGNPHEVEVGVKDALTVQGGQLEGPLYPRTVGDPDQLEDQEAGPVGYLRSLFDTVKTYVSSLSQQVNFLRSTQNGLSRRVIALEAVLGMIDLDPSASSFKYVHESDPEIEDEPQWLIEHNLNAEHVTVSIVGSEGQMVICDRVEQVDAGTCRILFAEPVEGYAVVTKVL